MRRRIRSDSEGRSDTVLETPFVTCFWCERDHSGPHPLSVCPSCTARLSTMQALEMSGSFPLNADAIDQTLMRTSPGNYALGYVDGETFLVYYVGRSDFDLRQRLREWVGMPSHYESFASPARAPWGLHLEGPTPVGIPASARVENVESSYTHFAYSYAHSADEAYAREWRNYDTFGGCDRLDNEAEPSSVVQPTMDLSANAAVGAEA